MWPFIVAFFVEMGLLFPFIKYVVKPIEKDPEEDSKLSSKDRLSLLKRLLGYAKGHTKEYILCIALLFCNVGFNVLYPYVIGEGLKELGNDTPNINVFINYQVIGIIALAICLVARYFQNIIIQKVGIKIIRGLRTNVFDHIQSLSHNQFHDVPVGVLVTRTTSDINTLSNFFSVQITNIIQCIGSIIVVFVAMVVINTKLSMIILDAFPVIVAITLFFRSINKKNYRNSRSTVAKMNAFLSENISGMRTTQIFNQEEKKYKEFRKANDALNKTSLKRLFSNAVLRPTIYITYVAVLCLILYYGTNTAIEVGFVAGLCLSFSDIYVFYEYLSTFFNPIQSLADNFDMVQYSISAAEKIFTILDIEPEIVDDIDAIDLDIKGEIEFKNVWFAYKDEDWILKDVSFKINPNDAVAFVGATGAGKSTILSLITRNYNIQKGEILIDGINVNKIKLLSLRKQIGEMLQDVFLFSGTIAENISLNDDSITDEDIYNACVEVNASKFIDKLADGIHSEVTEHGSNFSLGEKQLISFARVLVNKPKVIILDEATSNIDTETEHLIQDSLEKVIKGNTMLMVAHRLSTIQHATCIYVFDHGKIIEKGTHQELLQLHGRYYNLYLLQYQK